MGGGVRILGGIRPSYYWILAYVDLERINKGQHFQIEVISKLASEFLPDHSFSVASTKRTPYRSYYLLLCVVSFRLSGYSAIANEGCVVSTILTRIIFGIQERAHWRR